MIKLSQSMLVWVVFGVLSLCVLSPPGEAAEPAAQKAKAKAKAGAAAAPAAKPKANACGCYQDTSGSCFCAKKGRCGCPGECEPKGCEEKRAKDMEREIKAETKRAQESERKQKASSKAKNEGNSSADGDRKAPASSGKKTDTVGQ